MTKKGRIEQMRKSIASTMLLSITYLMNCTSQEQVKNVINATCYGYNLLDITDEELVEVCQAMAEILETRTMHVTVHESEQ